MVWIALFIASIFAVIGAEIAHARGYSRALGATVGWTGFGALLLVALLPEQTTTRHAAARPEARLPPGVARAERQLRAIYLLMGGAFGMFIVVGIILRIVASLGDVVVVEAVAVLLGVALVLALFYSWGLAFYFLYRDPRLPVTSRGGWLIALVFLQVWAAFAFHFWRRRQLERLSTARAWTGAV